MNQREVAAKLLTYHPNPRLRHKYMVLFPVDAREVVWQPPPLGYPGRLPFQIAKADLGIFCYEIFRMLYN